jgi:PilZ domain
MDKERRNSLRVPTNLTAQWHGLLARSEGTIADLSSTGCFVLTGGDASPGELISLRISIPGVMHLQVWGKVVYQIEEMGFALRFKDLSTTDQTLLNRLIEYVSNSQPV